MTWHPRNLTLDQMEERRLAAAQLLEQRQLSQTQIAREVGVSARSVRRWAHALSLGGKQALRKRPKSGRKPRLSADQWQQVLQILKQGAQAAGFPTERWTLARIQKVIVRQFDVHYHPHYLSERLHHLGWSVQKPQPQARERSETLVEAWLHRDWPRIKKSLSDGCRDRLYR